MSEEPAHRPSELPPPQQPDNPILPERSAPPTDQMISMIVEIANNTPESEIQRAIAQDETKYIYPAVKATIERKTQEALTYHDFQRAKAAQLEKDAELLAQTIGFEEMAARHKQMASEMREEAAKKLQQDLEAVNIIETQSTESYNDSKTPLMTRRAHIEKGAEIFIGWQNNSPDKLIESLDDCEDHMMDFSLFQAGNDELNPLGFDERVEVLAKGLIAVSKYCGLENGRTPYGTFTNDEAIDNDPSLQLYFKADSEARLKLDAMHGEGILFIPIRVNSGGSDEFATRVVYTKGKTKDRQDLANDVLRHIVTSTTIDKNTAVIPEGGMQNQEFTEEGLRKREGLKTKFEDYFFGLRIEPDRDITPAQAEKLNIFIEAYGNTFKNKNIAQKIVDPNLLITMDFAELVFTSKDALYAFTRGTDSSGKIRFMDKEKNPMYGFSNPDGSFNIEELTQYAQQLRVRAEVARRKFNNQDSLETIMMQIFARDLMGNMATLQENMVNDYEKAAKKRQTLTDALNHDAKAILHSAIAGTRMKLKNSDLFEVFSNVMTANEERLKSLPDDELTDFERELKEQLAIVAKQHEEAAKSNEQLIPQTTRERVATRLRDRKLGKRKAA